MPHAKSDDVVIHYLDIGSGPSTIWVHGAGGNAAIWWQQAEYFSKTHRFVAYDHRGFARSPCPMPQVLTTKTVPDALAVIRGELQNCELEIPDPTVGQIDFALVNAQVTLPGQAPQTIPQVADEQTCDPTVGGWYYDNPLAPATIILCPATCDLLESSSNAILEIVHGCETIIL